MDKEPPWMAECSVAAWPITRWRARDTVTESGSITMPIPITISIFFWAVHNGAGQIFVAAFGDRICSLLSGIKPFSIGSFFSSRISSSSEDLHS